MAMSIVTERRQPSAGDSAGAAEPGVYVGCSLLAPGWIFGALHAERATISSRPKQASNICLLYGMKRTLGELLLVDLRDPNVVGLSSRVSPPAARITCRASSLIIVSCPANVKAVARLTPSCSACLLYTRMTVAVAFT